MMASDLSSGCMETIDILDDEKEEGEISLEDVSSSEEGGMGHLTCSYVVHRTRSCPDCKMWDECAPWCTTMYHSKSQSKRDPVKGKENRHHVREVGCATTKHAVSTLQEKNDDLVPISSDSDMEIVGLTDTSNRSKTRIKKKKRKKKDYESLTIDELISPSSVDLPITEFSTLKKHYRELSPVHRSGRSKVVSRSPIRRHKSPVTTRPSYRTSRSPLNHPKSPILRRSPRRLRSPKRSPSRRSPLRTTRRPPSARSHVDRQGDVTRLLKKVKYLDSMGTRVSESSIDRNKEHQPSSLRDKLSNILKRAPNNNDKDDVTHFKEKLNAQIETANDADDEEDLALLRQKALETKQKKSNRSLDHPTESERVPIAKNDEDQDEEALQLRMIALRSAVMKKHQNRIQRGIKTSKRPSRSESPFSQSFLDNIPVPGDELLKFASPPRTPSFDSTHIEDMELDTDVEREKEKLPYSPTDKITADIPIDTTLLGIEPSDVSFINVNETNSPVFDDDAERDERMPLPLSTGITPASYYDNAYLHQQTAYKSQCYAQHGSETFHSDMNNGPGELPGHLRDDSVVCDLIDGICCRNRASYPPTGVMLMRVPDTLPVTEDLLLTPSITPDGIPPPPQIQQIMGQTTGGILFANVDSTFRSDACTHETRAISEYSVTDSSATFAVGYVEPVSPNGSMITIDDLPENEVDPLNSPIGDGRNLPITDYIPREAAPCQVIERETSQEPLYMQGVPDVTKDLNKIPTLINRTLVPSTLLKSNKQLQQPLPLTKKRETQSEPTFKSAEMRPVIVAADAKNGGNFTPVTLRLAKRSSSVITAIGAFEKSMNESSENDSGLENQGSSLSKNEAIELHPTVVDVTRTLIASNDVTSARKRKSRRGKRAKKNRRKNLDAAQLLEKQNNSCSDDGVNKNVNIINAFTLDRQTVESVQRKSNDNDNTQKSLENEESSKLQNATGTQEPMSINSSNIIVESREKNDHTSVECPQKENIESYCLSTNPAPDNSDSGTFNRIAETTKDVDNRRQSIDEDEDELRAILLASLKRTKPVETSSILTVPVTTKCITTSIQTSVQKTLTNTLPSSTNTTCTASNNVPLSSRIQQNSAEIKEKKINDMSTSTRNSGKKRSNSLDVLKIPLKKTRKALIPASTKVVNNAKKYQNMIVQRRMNLQKLSNNGKLNEKVWPNAPVSKVSLHAPDTQRFVISLGSDTDSESDGEKHKTTQRDVVSTTEKHQTQDIDSEFEKSVQKFLRDVRKEQEQSAVKPAASMQTAKRDVPPAKQTNKDSSNIHTPLAVRHLPASQQEEYRRLKQQILEREKLKLQKKVADSNNSNNNKLSNAKIATSSPIKSVSSCEKESTRIKTNQDKLKESEKNSQQSPTDVRKKDVDVAKNASTLNVHHTSVNKSLSANFVKHISSVHPQAKGAKKTIPTNLSIRIINEIAPSNTNAGSKTEDSDEKQCTDKQQHRPALRTLTTDEINRKHVQILLKSDTIGRVVTINDKSALQQDTASVSQSEKTVEHDVSVEILEERDRNNENTNNNSSMFSNASTIKLSGSNLSANLNRQEREDTLEATMLLSQYEMEQQREINHNISASVPPENNDNNNSSHNASHKSDVYADDKGSTDDVWDVLKKDVRTELDSLTSLSKTEQERYLRDTEHNLVARRYTVLDHLAEMSGNLRQWDMEKELQGSLASEVRKLKEQLKMAEERLQLQRDRVNSMGPKVSTAREKINAGRRECFKLSRICSTLGNRLVGKNYILPEAGDQLLSDKLKEIANHTRQFTKKKRIQSNDISENANSNSSQQILELTKDTHVEENLSLQELANNAAVTDLAGSKSDAFDLRQSNDNETSSMSEPSLDSPQTFSNQLTPARRKETSVNASEPCSDEQITPPNQNNVSSFEPNLCQSTPVNQNSERDCRMEDSSTLPNSSELGSSAIDSSSCQENEQTDKRASPQSPPSAITTTTTTTVSMKTMTITPYVSILMHLKTPRNTNPHGVLCPYEMMGICRDEDCPYIHQSRNET